MALSQKIVVGLLIALFAVSFLRLFRTPLKLAGKILLNTLLGFGALWAAGWAGLSLGANLWNALTVGVLGIPGFILLLLVQWVL